MQKAMVIIIQVQQMTEYKDQDNKWFIAKEHSLAGMRNYFKHKFIFLPQLKMS